MGTLVPASDAERSKNGHSYGERWFDLPPTHPAETLSDMPPVSSGPDHVAAGHQAALRRLPITTGCPARAQAPVPPMTEYAS